MTAREEPSYLAFARANNRQGFPSGPTVVRELVDRIDRDAAALKARDGLLAAVLAVHQPLDAVMNPGRHERIVKVCTGCGTDDGNWQRFPCPTVRAIESGRVAAS